MTTIVGSAPMELEKVFRLTTLDLAMKLSIEECHRIAYVAYIDEAVPPEYGDDFRIYLFTTLESRRQIGPLKVQFLEEILTKIGRNDLLNLISKYKEKSVYKKAKKKESKKKLQQDQKKDSATPPSTIQQYEETYAIFLTQFSQMALSMRSALEAGDLPKIKHAFSSVASNGDAVTHTLRKNLSLAGVNSDSICTSSSGESSAIVSPNSTPPPVRMEPPIANAQVQCPSDMILDVEESSSDQFETSCAAELTQETALTQPPCQASQTHTPNIPMFVYCESPSSQRLSTPTNLEDVENTTGEGTGDSGVGDMTAHTLSREARDQITPKPRPDPLLEDDDDADDHLAQRAGYTPLIIRKMEPDHSSEYAKPNIRPEADNKQDSEAYS